MRSRLLLRLVCVVSLVCIPNIYGMHLCTSAVTGSGGTSSSSVESGPSLLQKAETVGHFEMAPASARRDVLKQFAAWKKLREQQHIVSSHVPEGAKVEHATWMDTLSAMDFARDVPVVDAAFAKLADSDVLMPSLKSFGYQRVASLAVVEGFAGLWTRGGGDQVKGLVPFNLSQIMSPGDIQRLLQAGEVLERTKNVTDDAKTIELGKGARQQVRQLMKEALMHPQALNPIMLKLLQVAVLSQASHSYIPIIFWTSEHTHQAFLQFRETIRYHVAHAEFIEDEQTNERFRRMIVNYLDASAALGETLVLGYQQGLNLIDENGGGPGIPDFREGTPAVGAGAGLFKHVMDATGKTAKLRAFGVRHFAFRNIEVVGPIESEYLTYRGAKKPVGLVVVNNDGYAGGAPYRMTMLDGPVRYMMLESSNVSEELRRDNPLHNANTIFVDIDLESPNTLAFEPTVGLHRAKINAGDFTLENPTTLIAGLVGNNFQELKKYEHYVERGADVTKYHVENLRRIAASPGTLIP